MALALVYPDPDTFLEASGDSASRRVQAANRAGKDVLADQVRLERDTITQLLKRLQTLQAGLRQRLLAADGSVTDFRRFDLQARLADVDRMIADATADLAKLSERSYAKAAEHGGEHADNPIRAAQLTITQGTPGVSSELVQATFGNTVDLLTQPMQQFATDTKVALRQVALAGDGRFEAIARLRDKIAGAGFDNAQYRAERIIRTELSRVFNMSTYDRMVKLAGEFPFLRKGWRAANDNRTRLGHKEAHRTYARGQGIPMAQRFSINVYDERGKAPKLIGVALLRFPVDPDGQPAGKLSAGATIMCRCNGFVDFDMKDFAAFTAQKVSLALGKPTPTPPAPKLPAPKAPKVKTPKVKTPKVKTPKSADVVPTPGPAAKIGPAGKAVSQGVNYQFMPKTMHEQVKKALAILDSVHGDGNLPLIPAVEMDAIYRAKGYQAYYARDKATQTPKELAFNPVSMKTQPNLLVFHETGHFLDHVGFNSDRATMSSEDSDLMDGWRKAVRNSQSIKTLEKWKLRDAGTPRGVEASQVDYMLTTREIWARSYAQYIAVKSGNRAALAELRNLQAAGTYRPVHPDTRFNRQPSAAPPDPKSWDYPWQWTDEDFQPIFEQIDIIMERAGWRKLGN